MPHTIRLRTDVFTKAARLPGFHSDYALAKAVDLNRSMVARVHSGELRPGPAFIGGALVALAPMQSDDLFEVVPASLRQKITQQKGRAVPTSTPDTAPSTTLQAALSYAELGWPVLPGAVWKDGHFADPADELPVTRPCLRPIQEATTDVALVEEWWSAPGLHTPNVFTVTGSELGAFAVAESLVMALADDPWFAAFPTPVLAFPNIPIAYFLVRPPMPSVLMSHEARVVEAGMPMPLPPSALETTPVIWLVTPEQAGGRLMPGDALADLIQSFKKRKSA